MYVSHTMYVGLSTLTNVYTCVTALNETILITPLISMCTGKIVNIKDAYKHPNFFKDIDMSTGFHTR